ncbi:hypothetical protein CLOBOL_03500 [Enterocloster bolteae ATCC BAA-613]|uniref:Uncharacterized protein n=1 Tax=Enterocloster bolteae (strain ATCC BAA-613 / DSM 15670 / CCUG 46953 / JCM 12243 / WAL 16351) TaxID=411902 RepID=A8RT01_ENTBW|nr:hypothetical protein CLOBOL_03500 [Enterocloster bolteae ATCC BAA-613]
MNLLLFHLKYSACFLFSDIIIYSFLTTVKQGYIYF